ncbi:MAG: energy transducer TonB [Deltaproteobacteria bacterium]|nr:energy transducer TonB [Deltaproteobacteria bacterium]
MSIKILSLDKGQLFVFLIISILLHIGIILIVPHAREDKKVLPRLIPVDVIELPQPKKIEEGKTVEKVQGGEQKKEILPVPPPAKEEETANHIPIKGHPVEPEQALPLETKNSLKEEEQEIQSQKSEKNKETPQSPEALKQEKPLSLYPTGERLSELSEKYEKETPVAEENKSLSLEASDPKSISYLQGLKGKIYHKWEYPEAAARTGQTGRLWVRFIIKKDGELEEVIVIKSSGYPMLDDAALSAIRLAAPYYPFPNGFGSLERITINASFEYMIEFLPRVKR